MVACLAASVLAAPARAGDALCLSHDRMIRVLARDFGETLAYAGLGRAGHRVEVYASAETGRWTLAVIRPDGIACILSTGTGAPPRPMI